MCILKHCLTFVGRDGYETGEFSVTIVEYEWREMKHVESFSGKNFYE